jgi:hypothetical protein
MRPSANVLWLGVAICLSCAPSEVPGSANPQVSQISTTASPTASSPTVSRVDSVSPPTNDRPPDSVPLNTLRDSLSVADNPEPKVPMVFLDVCPGELCSFGTRIVCDSISARSEPRPGTPIVFTAHRMDTLITITGNQVVERAGKIIFRDTVHVRESTNRYLFTPSDTLYPLSYDGEGEGTWFFHGRVQGGVWFFHERDGPQEDPDIVMVRKRITDWWVKASNRDGKEGWFKFRSMIFVDPESDYADSCPSK